MLHSIEGCLLKQKNLKAQFKLADTPDKKYEKIIELGRKLPPYPHMTKEPQHVVKGCQSLMYLHAQLSQDGKMLFHADSEALISKGLAALLIHIYNDEPPEVVLTCPPSVLEELGISHFLSPGRSHGLFSLMNQMKQEAMKLNLKLGGFSS